MTGTSRARRILDAAYKRHTWQQRAHEAAMRDIAALDGMMHDVGRERITRERDVQEKMAQTLERMVADLDDMADGAHEAHERKVAAERLIGTLGNPRWKEVMTLRYVCQMPWSEVAERMRTTDDAVKRMRDRALCALEAMDGIGNR